MKRLHHYSQYFLRDPRLVKQLIGHTNIKKSDLVYDIGAGSGVISSALAGRCKHVIAIEVEPRMAIKLRQNMEHYSNVSVVHKDFLKLPLPVEPYKIFANIPFHISSPVVQYITSAKNPPDATYLIVQKQFANKLRGDSAHFTSQLGMLIGPWFSVRIRKMLQKKDFWPHPNVDTVLLEIIPREKPLIPHSMRGAYEQFTTTCFLSPTYYKAQPLELAHISPEANPSRTTLDQWTQLFMAASHTSSEKKKPRR